jgi:hypothetical protein
MTHDLHDYIEQLGTKMDAEYRRIRKSASQDPGTAGDEGEENWAELLRDWLPPAYQVVTKGQLLSSDGSLSPQIDVLVLKPSYPRALHHRKKYLVAGVAAAFECKLTLKRDHIIKSVQTAARVKRMARPSDGTPYRELSVQPVFGILAHSGGWKRSDDVEATIETIDEILNYADVAHVKHPREMLDLLCISNLATWVTSKQPLSDPADQIDLRVRSKLDPKGSPATSYMCHFGEKGFGDAISTFKPVGVFISELLVKLAWEDSALRNIAGYFLDVEFSTAASGKVRYWPRSIYSPQLRRKLKLSSLNQNIGWGEWDSSLE